MLPPRPYEQDPQSGQYYLQVGRNGRALVDYADAVHFAQWAWRNSSRNEPKTSRIVDGKRKDAYLHREVAERMGLSLAGEIIWVNGNRHDCRRDNLRARLLGQHKELRPYWVEPFSGTALFYLSDGQHAVCDLEDAAYLGQWNWSYNHGYADRAQIVDERLVRVPMAHEVVRRMGLVRGELQVDHINLCKSDNRRSNLRLATHAQNVRNRSVGVTNKSGIKGVCWNAAQGKWIAQISVDNRKVSLGRFSSKEEAAEAYRHAVAKYFGEFGRVE